MSKPMPAVDDLRKNIVGGIYRGENNHAYYVANICLSNVITVPVSQGKHNFAPSCCLVDLTEGTPDIVSFPLEVLYEFRERVSKETLSAPEETRLEKFIAGFEPESPAAHEEHRENRESLLEKFAEWF